MTMPGNLFALLLLLFAFTACDDEDDTPTPQPTKTATFTVTIENVSGNSGADENGTVREVDDAFTYPPVADAIRVTISTEN